MEQSKFLISQIFVTKAGKLLSLFSDVEMAWA